MARMHAHADGPTDRPLPEGLVTRPLTTADAATVTELIATEELANLGEVAIEEADIVSEWQRPIFDVAANTIGVLDGDRLVAYGEWSLGDRGDAAVHPDYHGRGIGTHLAGWVRDRARAGGAARVGMPVPQGSPGDRLLDALGWRERWTSWALRLPADREIPPRPLPDGYAVRQAEQADHAAVWTVLEDTFLEWSDRPRQTFEDFAAQVMDRPGAEPWNLRVVTDPDGTVVGAAHIVLSLGAGAVTRVGVRRDRRRRGLATALLADAFAEARAHGAATSELGTDSRTGALGLYERLGMEVHQVWVNRAVELDA